MNVKSNPVALLWKHRHLLWLTTVTDIRSRFAGSVLGLVWLVLYPLLLLGCYGVIYAFVFKIRVTAFNSYEYVALIFCGLIPFLGFSEALGSGVASITNNKNLIKNTLFPIELIPVKAVLASQCTQAAGTVLLLFVLFGIGKLGFWSLLLPVVWLCQIFFSIGLIWILSSLNVYFKDLQNVVPLLILLLMMISPIAYTEEMIPGALKPFLALNPLYYLIRTNQDILLMNRFPQAGALVIFAGLSGFFFFAGYWFFSKMKVGFADNV